MAPGYYWARDRSQSIKQPEIVKVVDYGYGEQVVLDFNGGEYAISEFDFGPRVKGQDEDSEA